MLKDTINGPNYYLDVSTTTYPLEVADNEAQLYIYV
jgi:hypothetical protein